VYLNVSSSQINIVSVTPSSTNVAARSARVLNSAIEEFGYQVVYTVFVEGTDAEREAALLTALDNDSSVLVPTLEVVIVQLNLGNFTVFWTTPPNVLLWIYTTATLTSTTATSTTCCVCDLPTVDGVPAGLIGDDFNSTSNMSDLIRIECDGLSWFDLCHPYCGPGYVGVESMSCANTTTPMIPSSFVGVARCERDVCSGSPPAPLTGYEPWGSNCTGMLYQERCTTSCSDGYTDLGVPVQLECLASTAWPVSGPVQYGWASSSGTCTELSCEAGSVPYWWGVVDSSSCIGTASRASCSPVCDESYDLVEPINCTKGQFDPIPLVCIPSEHSEALEYDVGVLLLPMAIATNEIGSSSWLTADWVSSDEIHAAIISLLANTLGLLPGQVFVSGVIGLNSDSSYVIPAARRLTTQQGVFFNAVLQPYPIDNLTALEARTSDLGGGNFTDQLAAALQRAAVSPPAGLALATLVTWPTEHASFTLPMARWVARTEWSACSNLCGVGAQTRIVQCVGAWDSNATDLCDANAAPSFTMESFMPDSKPCEQYIQCPYDWSCPSGPDPVTGEGCEAQASAVFIALAVVLLCCACLLCAYLRKWLMARPEKTATNIEWTREQRSAHYSNRGSAILTPKGGRGDPIGPVDLDLSGAAEFVLQMRVATAAKDALLVGKVYRRGDVTSKKSGEAKALVIKQGFPAWQIGEDAIYGKTYIADGEQHDISISYSGEDDQYVLAVDGIEEARGLRGVADNPDTSLVLGTASAPRDDTFNALYPLFEELRRAGVEVSPLEDRAEEPLFDGDIEGLTWKEYQLNRDDGHMAWFAYDLYIGVEETTRQAPEVFHKGQAVEYWSKTVQTWMPAEILDAADPYYDDTLGLNALGFDIYVRAASQTALGVGMMDLRAPFASGEAVSVFSQKHGKWFPARIHRPRNASDHRGGYDVRLEDVLESYNSEGEEVETYYKSELQKDLARYQGMSGQDEEPILKNMTAKRLRRRYTMGERVLLYQGTGEGFMEVEVVHEEADHKPGMESVFVAMGAHNDDNMVDNMSPSPSPERGGRSPSPAGNATNDDEGAHRRARRYNFSEQRHASIVVRRIRSGSAVSNETMKVPEYALRRVGALGSGDAPPRRSSPNARGPPRRRTDGSPHAEDEFEL